MLPQALWFRRVRRSISAVVLISIAINIGMWLERILIIWNTLSHGYCRSLWRLFSSDVLGLDSCCSAPLGLFAFLFLCFVRLVPAVSMYELRKLCREEGAA